MRTLLVASTGGHLMELHRLQSRLVPASDSVVWVTAENAQSRALLAGQDVVMMPPVNPRGYGALARTLAPARRVLRESGAERVVSTGAAVALAFLPAARRDSLSCHYIESAARTDGPSATGRLLQGTRSCALYSQHEVWAGRSWQFRGSVFDGLEAVPVPAPQPVRRVLVSLGTSPFPFTRLVRRLAAVLPAHVEVVWQVGSTPVGELPGRVVTTLGHDDLVSEMHAADVVVCHAGVGSALTALATGRSPVLVPRRVGAREHVDEHQLQIARALAARGLAVAASAADLTFEHLERAAAVATRSTEHPPPFRLVEQGRRSSRGGAGPGAPQRPGERA
jgi:UDP-N-acetylglucosamine transferase subunit ALG13